MICQASTCGHPARLSATLVKSVTEAHVSSAVTGSFQAIAVDMMGGMRQTSISACMDPHLSFLPGWMLVYRVLDVVELAGVGISLLLSEPTNRSCTHLHQLLVSHMIESNRSVRSDEMQLDRYSAKHSCENKILSTIVSMAPIAEEVGSEDASPSR